MFKVSAYQYFYLNTSMKLLEQVNLFLSRGFHNYSDTEALHTVKSHPPSFRVEVR